MTTQEEQTRIRKTVMQSARGAAMLHLAYVGVTGELFEALHALDRGTAGAIAKKAGRDPGYVVRWCDAAYAFELLREAEDGVFELTPLGAAFLPDAAGTTMPMAIGAVLGAHMAERAAGLMATGERPGESVLAERETILPWFGPMLEKQFGPFFEAEIAGAIDVFAPIDARGGTVVDLGCGNGWYLRGLAKKYPRIRGVGLDGFEANIEAAAALAAKEGYGERLSFRTGDLHRFTVDEPVDAIAMNRALHHVWSDKDDVFRILREHLVTGGVAVIWEPAWPDDRAALRAEAMRPMAFQNLAEHVQGNHFLRPEEISEALQATGFDTETRLFLEGREAVVIGTKRA